jgi:hypothetical protein
MDVTFFEGKAFYHSEGESLDYVSSSQGWDMSPGTLHSLDKGCINQGEVTTPDNTQNPSNLIPEIESLNPRPPIQRVYTRRNRNELENQEHQPHSQVVDPSESYDTSQGQSEDITTLESTERSVSTVNHDDRPIALRKGTRACTQYPLYNLIAIDNISTSYQVFIQNLDKNNIPHSIHEALRIPE